ncbi:MAG TPA: DUF805 domain-containing protein [Caulobacteraceae bacterium]|nr:DUF805 domain-containing protein [Caulobacteraceae bacterium]
MLSAVFSFSGRLNRLQYFLGSWGLGTALVVLVVVLLASVGAMSGGGTPGPAALTQLGVTALLALLVIAPIYFWISFSLQARRFRDIGWEPVFVIPAWIGASIVDRIAVMGAPQIAVIHGSGVSWFGLLLNLGLAGCLLFWPGKPPFDVASVFDDVPPPVQPTQARPAAPATARTQPLAAPAGFGRRGL